MNDPHMTCVKSNPENSSIAFFNVLLRMVHWEAPLDIVSHGKSDKYFTHRFTYIIHWDIFQKQLQFWGWSQARDRAPEQYAYGNKMGVQDERWSYVYDSRHAADTRENIILWRRKKLCSDFETIAIYQPAFVTCWKSYDNNLSKPLHKIDRGRESHKPLLTSK